MVNDENSHSALRKMSGVSLFLLQQKSNRGTVEYNNPSELIENSKMLKIKYPKLYETLKFHDNLSVSYNLQQIHLNQQLKISLDLEYNRNDNKQNEMDIDSDECLR